MNVQVNTITLLDSGELLESIADYIKGLDLEAMGWEPGEQEARVGFETSFDDLFIELKGRVYYYEYSDRYQLSVEFIITYGDDVVRATINGEDEDNFIQEIERKIN